MKKLFIISVLMLSSMAAQANTPLANLHLIPEASRDSAPAFVSENLRGGNSSLEDYKGKLVLLNFWATWCMPCRAEMPGMETLWKKYKEQGLVIVAVSVDEGSSGRIKTFTEILDLSFPVLLDPESKVSDLYEVSNMPTSFLIDRNGKVISRIVGTEEWSSPASIQLVESLLSQ